MSSGRKRGFHAAGDEQRLGREAAREVRELQVEAQRHARGGDADDVPRVAQQLALERALRRVRRSSWDRRPRTCAPAFCSTPARRQTPSGGARKVYSPQCGS